jgi:hypothetical protein
MSNSTFDLKLFIRESKALLLNPKECFSSMKTSGGIAEPLIKVVIYGAIAGALALLWSILNVGARSVGLFGGSYGVMAFISYVIGSIIILFAGAVILLIISAVCNGNTNYEASLRVIASLLVIMPIAEFFGFTGMINPFFGWSISICIHLFSVWLLYNGLVSALKAKPETARIVMYIIAALIVLFMFIGMSLRMRTNDRLDDDSSRSQNELVNDQDK